MIKWLLTVSLGGFYNLRKHWFLLFANNGTDRRTNERTQPLIELRYRMSKIHWSPLHCMYCMCSIPSSSLLFLLFYRIAKEGKRGIPEEETSSAKSVEMPSRCRVERRIRSPRMQPNLQVQRGRCRRMQRKMQEAQWAAQKAASGGGDGGGGRSAFTEVKV